MEPGAIGKWLIYIGLGLAAVGAAVWIAGRIGVPLGRLPGDIRIDRPGGSFHFPIVTCIAISVLLTIAVNLVLWLMRR